MTTTTPRLSYMDAVRSVTGFEDDLIVKKFDRTLSQMLDFDSIRTARALIMVIQTRSGVALADAYKSAMELTLEQANDYFATGLDDADDLDPDQPTSDQGKGDSLDG